MKPEKKLLDRKIPKEKTICWCRGNLEGVNPCKMPTTINQRCSKPNAIFPSWSKCTIVPCHPGKLGDEKTEFESVVSERKIIKTKNTFNETCWSLYCIIPRLRMLPGCIFSCLSLFGKLQWCCDDVCFVRRIFDVKLWCCKVVVVRRCNMLATTTLGSRMRSKGRLRD